MLIWILLGALVGWLVGEAQQRVTHIIVGIIGALLGGFIIALLGFGGTSLSSLVVAPISAFVLVQIVKSFGNAPTQSNRQAKVAAGPTRRDRFQDRECSVGKLHPQLAKPVKQYLSGSNKVLACYEIKAVTKKMEPTWFDKAFSPTATSFFAVVVTQTHLISAGYGYDDSARKYGIEVDLTKLVDIVSVQEASYSDQVIISVIGPGEKDEPHIFSSKQNARKFVNVLKQAVAQAKGGSSASPQEKRQIAEQLSNVVEKTFQWSWPAKNQKGVVYARFDKEDDSLLLYINAGWSVASGKGRLPADMIAIWKELIGNFTVEGIPATEYISMAKKQYRGRFGMKLTHQDTWRADIAIFEDKPDGRLNVHAGNFIRFYRK